MTLENGLNQSPSLTVLPTNVTFNVIHGHQIRYHKCRFKKKSGGGDSQSMEIPNPGCLSTYI